MKTYKLEQTKVEDKVLCDLCGKDINHAWVEYDGEARVTIECTTGTFHSVSDDSTKDFSTDICTKCFLTKIKPELRRIGVKFRIFDHSNGSETEDNGEDEK